MDSASMDATRSPIPTCMDHATDAQQELATYYGIVIAIAIVMLCPLPA